MRITFTQSGGFAGLLRHSTVDAADLPAVERRMLEQLVEASGLTASCELLSEGARDARRYEFVIERDGAVVRVCCDDRCLPAAARPLAGFLAARSRPGPPPAALGAQGDPWGRFVGAVVARWHDDGRSMTLVEPFAYVDPRDVQWNAPAGSEVNGASIPRAFWSLIGGPFAGKFRDASVVHDVACMERSRAWRDVHRMFYEACRCGGVDAALAKTMYYAVFHFGPRWRIEERRTLVAGRTVTERVAVAEAVPEPPPDIAEQAARWFATHDVGVDEIPTLPVPPGG